MTASAHYSPYSFRMSAGSPFLFFIWFRFRIFAYMYVSYALFIVYVHSLQTHFDVIHCCFFCIIWKILSRQRLMRVSASGFAHKQSYRFVRRWNFGIEFIYLLAIDTGHHRNGIKFNVFALDSQSIKHGQSSIFNFQKWIVCPIVLTFGVRAKLNWIPWHWSRMFDRQNFIGKFSFVAQYKKEKKYLMISQRFMWMWHLALPFGVVPVTSQLHTNWQEKRVLFSGD